MAKTRSRKVDVHGRNTDWKHIRLERYVYESEAWDSMGFAAQILWLALTYRHNGKNNGRIFLSYREARKKMKCGNSTIRRAFEELEDRRFIRVMKKGGFSQKHATEGARASEYKLTHLVSDVNDPDYRAFRRWNGKTD